MALLVPNMNIFSYYFFHSSCEKREIETKKALTDLDRHIALGMQGKKRTTTDFDISSSLTSPHPNRASLLLVLLTAQLQLMRIIK